MQYQEWGKSKCLLSKFGKDFSFISHCGIFILYHTWYGFPDLHILYCHFDPISIFPFVEIIILPNQTKLPNSQKRVISYNRDFSKLNFWGN